MYKSRRPSSITRTFEVVRILTRKRETMIDEQTIQKLCDLKLLAMADAVRELLTTAPGSEMSFRGKAGPRGRSRMDRPREPAADTEAEGGQARHERHPR